MSGRREAPLLEARRRPARFDLLGVGQCSLDHVGLVDAMPSFGGKLRMSSAHALPGGQVATAVRAAARLGLRAALVTSIGDDGAEERVLAPAREEGVELVALKRVPGAASQLAFILVERKSGERSVLWYRDPRLALAPSDIPREAIHATRLLHLDAGDPEAGAWAAGVAQEAGVPVLLDADHYAPSLEPLLERVDYPVVSSEFADALGGAAEALRELAHRGARLPVVTLGSRGCLAGSPPGWLSPGFRVDARDTTGAGDAFHAGFAWALLAGHGAASVLRFANAVAALNCCALGAQGGLPTRREVERFLEDATPAPAEPERPGQP